LQGKHANQCISKQPVVLVLLPLLLLLLLL
jgi:hypothetical protein